MPSMLFFAMAMVDDHVVTLLIFARQILANNLFLSPNIYKPNNKNDQ